MGVKQARVLIVEDERDVREPLARFLESEGLSVATASNGQVAVAKLAEAAFDFVLTDIQMPGMGGMELLRHVRSEYPAIPVMVFTAFGSVEDAVDVIRMGAVDYALKPVIFEDVLQRINSNLDRLEENRPPLPSRKPGDRYPGLDAIIGNSPVIRDLKDRIRRVARSGSSVVIHGASGTGKELVARALHSLSDRKNHPFVAVNCAAIPENLLESEFFGHKEGAFTGATNDRKGLLESAQHGVFFLDEVSELPISMQVKLLRAIEEREVTAVGATKPIELDIAVISASARKLKPLVESGAFREDLYFRLNVIELYVPSLQDRRDDIPALAQHFLDQVRLKVSGDVSGFSKEILPALMQYAWPGNIRELRNVIERAVVLCSGREILLTDLPQEIAACGWEVEINGTHKSAMKDFEKELILKALRSSNHDKKIAAEMLGMGLSTLYRKMEDYHIE